MKKFVAMILAAVMVLALAACGNNQGGGNTATTAAGGGETKAATQAQTEAAKTDDNSGTEEKSKITIGSTQKVTVPLDGANEANMFGFGICCDMLVYIDQNGEVKSDILESWGTTDAGVTMTLKEGVTFTDGKPCTAEDILWTYEDANERGAGDESWTTYFDWDNAEIKDDGRTLFVPTFEPYAPGIMGLTTVSAYIKSKAYIEEHPYEDSIWWDVVEGTGPYECVEQIDGAHSLYKLRDNYWDTTKEYVYDEIQFNFYSDQNAMAIELQNGVIDIALDINSYYYDEFSKDSAYTVKMHGEGNITAIGFDETKVEAFKNPKVREAIALAFNADEAGIVGASGMYTVADSVLSANTFGYKSAGSYLNGSDADIAKAKDLMAEAGYPDGFDVKLSVRDRDSDLGEYAQGALAKIGINCEFEAMEFMNYIMANRNGELECTIADCQGDNSGEPSNVYTKFTTDQNSNLGVIFEDDFNELCKKASTTVDASERQKLVEEIQDYIYEGNYRIYLYEKQKGWVYNSSVLPEDFEIYCGNFIFGLRRTK